MAARLAFGVAKHRQYKAQNAPLTFRDGLPLYIRRPIDVAIETLRAQRKLQVFVGAQLDCFSNEAAGAGTPASVNRSSAKGVVTT